MSELYKGEHKERGKQKQKDLTQLCFLFAQRIEIIPSYDLFKIHFSYLIFPNCLICPLVKVWRFLLIKQKRQYSACRNLLPCSIECSTIDW